MAMIFCPDCKQKVSDRAVACPACGFPISEPPSVTSAEPIRVMTAEDEQKETETLAFIGFGIIAALAVGMGALAYYLSGSRPIGGIAGCIGAVAGLGVCMWFKELRGPVLIVGGAILLVGGGILAALYFGK